MLDKVITPSVLQDAKHKQVRNDSIRTLQQINPKDSTDQYAVQNYPVKDGLSTAAQATSLGAVGAGVVEAGAATAATVTTTASNVLQTAQKFAGRAGMVGAVGAGTLVTAHGVATGNTEEIASGVGGTSGAIGGAILGAKAGALGGGAWGSVVPVVGNAVGAAVGGVVGGLAGGFAGSEVGQKLAHEAIDLGKQAVNSETAKNLKETAASAIDYVNQTADNLEYQAYAKARELTDSLKKSGMIADKNTSQPIVTDAFQPNTQLSVKAPATQNVFP